MQHNNNKKEKNLAARSDQKLGATQEKPGGGIRLNARRVYGLPRVQGRKVTVKSSRLRREAAYVFRGSGVRGLVGLIPTTTRRTPSRRLGAGRPAVGLTTDFAKAAPPPDPSQRLAP